LGRLRARGAWKERERKTIGLKSGIFEKDAQGV